MRPGTRWFALVGLLAVSTALVAFGDKARSGDADVDKAVEAVVKPPPSGHDRPQADTAPAEADAGEGIPAAMIQEIQPRTPPPEVIKAFAVRSWTSPPPASVRASVPPLPFAFLGKKLEDGSWQIFLGQGERTYIVKEADVIDDRYRVDSIRPPAMTFTYLPLLQRQTLTIGEAP